MRRKTVLALLICSGLILGSCSPTPEEVIPTLEPVLPPLPSPTPQSLSISPLPTTTPIPLGRAPTPGQYPGFGTEPTSRCLAGSSGAVRLPGMRFGVNILPRESQPDQMLAHARTMNANWVRATLFWSDMEPQPGIYRWELLDRLVNSAQEQNIKLLLVVTDSPAWANPTGGLPNQPSQLGGFMGTLTARAQGKIAAYEIWQYPNTAAANGGTVADPGHYVEVLSAAHDAIKQNDPCALVLNGALLPTATRDPKIAIDDLKFYRDMLLYNDGAARHAYDLLAIRLNTSGQPPNTSWSYQQPSLSRGYYGHFGPIRKNMIALGDGDKHMWVVEIGYQQEGEFAVTPEQQASYLIETFERTKLFFHEISAIFVRDLASGPLASGEASYSLLTRDGTPGAAYQALSTYFAQQREQAQRVVEFKEANLVVLWWLPTPKPARLILGPDGAIYVPNQEGTMSVFDQSGAFRAVELPNGKIIGVAIDKDHRRYMALDNGLLMASDAGGMSIWMAQMSAGAATPLLLSADQQTLYIGTGAERLEAYSASDGSLRWQTPLAGSIPGAPALGLDGTIYVGGSDGILFAIAPNGVEQWRYQTDSWVHAAPIISGTTIYGLSEGGALFALDPSGAQLWRVELGVPAVGMALGKDNDLYITTQDGRLHAFALNGQPGWSIALGSERPTAPAVGEDGHIYVGAVDGGFRAVRPDGTLLGAFNFIEPIEVAPLAGPNGAVYVATQLGGDALVAFGSQELKERYTIP